MTVCVMRAVTCATSKGQHRQVGICPHPRKCDSLCVCVGGCLWQVIFNLSPEGEYRFPGEGKKRRWGQGMSHPNNMGNVRG